MTAPPFVHLHTHSEYSFLDGASRVQQLVSRAAELGMPALALTDHNSVAGAVKFVATCQQYHVAPILGSEITLEDGSHLTLLAENRAGYANLCRLLSLAHNNAEAGGARRDPRLPWSALPTCADGLICLSGCRKGRVPSLLLSHRAEAAEHAACLLLDIFGPNHFFLELQDDLTPDATRLCYALSQLAQHLGIKAVATNNVHYAAPEGYIAHDVLRCIAAGITLTTPHESRPFNAERYLKSAAEMHACFAWNADALVQTMAIAQRCGNVLPTGEEITPRYEEGDAQAALRERAYAGTKERYQNITRPIRERLDHELSVIGTLGFSDYMLLCHDIVRWARREENIRCTGRGSAADSLVAYVLYLTDVDVMARGLPFARFLMPNKTPDVDCDFPSDRRDDVLRHIQRRYGADRVGMACTFHTYHARGAVRDVGKVLALPPDTLTVFGERLQLHLGADHLDAAFDTCAELKYQQHLKERFRLLFDLCGRIAGFPRHLGTHSSGVLVSRVPLTTVAPLIPSAKGVLPIWTLDKDDSEEVGGIKFDVLALRILSSVADTEKNIQTVSDPDFKYEAIPHDDTPTYRMLQKGKALGTFQFESAAQLSLSVEMLPQEFEDLVAAVALIRPANNRSGARLQNTVRRYLDSRSGYQRIDYTHPCLKPILSRTFGCIIFQEQVDLVIAAMTGCTHAEGERFRKGLAKHTRAETLADAGEQFMTACLKHHPRLPKQRAFDLWNQIKGWGGYGFIEGHAASFALTGYRTAYLSVHHAAAFYAGLINHQPMGFYPPNSLVSEARRRGVTTLSVDINASEDKCYADKESNLRLGLRTIERLGEADRQTILSVRAAGGAFRSLLDFCVRVVLRRDRLENLILAGAFDSLHPHRRGLLLRLDETLTLAVAHRAEMSHSGQGALAFGAWHTIPTPCATDIADFSEWERFHWTWRITGICADTHPLALYRERLAHKGILSVEEACAQPTGTRVTVAGLNIRPHRPPTRSGKPILFTTVEDETDILQVVCFDEALETTTAVFLLSAAVIVRGTMERRGGGASLLVEQAIPLRLHTA